ncbi:cAMP-responsive element-binding protein-like 2 [Artemia franciscana]|uniref:cAMP-responsive element-binding protein-like 2 n=1 Tax=Artemia franciscana TaxID=6661 RepID=UPI0032DBAEFB
MEIEDTNSRRESDLMSLVFEAERELQDLVDAKYQNLDSKGGPSEEDARPGRRPGKRQERSDMKAKLERSRQSARECRARKKLRYQYLEELISSREKAIFELRKELERYRQMVHDMDDGRTPDGLQQLIDEGNQLAP